MAREIVINGYTFRPSPSNGVIVTGPGIQSVGIQIVDDVRALTIRNFQGWEKSPNVTPEAAAVLAAFTDADVAAIKDALIPKPPLPEPPPVATPVPPAQDPVAQQADNTAAAAATPAPDTTTATVPPAPPVAGTPPVVPSAQPDQPRPAGNLANDNNPQSSNVAPLGQPNPTASQSPVTAPGDGNILPQPNVLDRFSSYTYQAAVYVLSPQQFNAFQRSQKKSVNGYNLLFQSGGAPNNVGGPQGALGTAYAAARADLEAEGIGFVPGVPGTPGPNAPDAGRNPFFPNDYYIDSITLENTPLGKGTGASHGSTNLKFTVLEPANITLLDNIYQAVQDIAPTTSAGVINYAAACYLMIIRFYGYDEQGQIKRVAAFDEKTNQTDPNAVVEKYIPFRIKGINWEVASKGVSYEFDTVPIGQIIAGSTRRGTIPADIELRGQTVGDLLGSNSSDESATANANTQGLEVRAEDGSLSTLKRNPETGELYNPVPPPKASAAQQKNSQNSSLVAMLNAEQQKLVKEGKYEVADEFEIVFVKGAEKIRDATVTKPGPDKNKNAANPGPAPQRDPSGLSPDKGSVNTNSRNQGITAGMQVLQAIDIAIRNSNYITDQASTVITEGTDSRIEANGTSAPKEFTWFNVAMSVEQLAYDTKRNDFAYRVRYTIMPYAVQDFQSLYFRIPKFRGVVKSYPYWFTGVNTAVLDYKASFNKMYHLTVSGSSTESSLLARSRQDFVTSMRDMPFLNYQARSTENSQGAAGRANELAANAAEYLYNAADNASADITIVGDPAWIQQGSVVSQIDPGKPDYNPFNADGSINFDTNDVLFEIAWQRPEDYDLYTGQADPYARTQNIFGNREPRQSVIYRVKTVVNEFKQGRFQQRINGVLYRWPVRRPDPNANPTATSAAAAAANNGGSAGASGGINNASSGIEPGQNARDDLLARADLSTRTNQSLAVQLRTGVQLNSTAGAGRGVVAGPTAAEIAAYQASRNGQTAAAAVSASAAPSARQAPMSRPSAYAAGATQTVANSRPRPADTVSALPPPGPVSSNGSVVGGSRPGTQPAARSNSTVNRPTNPPQQGSRDY